MYMNDVVDENHVSTVFSVSKHLMMHRLDFTSTINKKIHVWEIRAALFFIFGKDNIKNGRLHELINQSLRAFIVDCKMKATYLGMRFRYL